MTGKTQQVNKSTSNYVALHYTTAKRTSTRRAMRCLVRPIKRHSSATEFNRKQTSSETSCQQLR